MALADQAGGLELHPLDRRIDETHGAARGALFAHHMPGFERQAQFDLDAHGAEVAEPREAEVEVRRKPLGLQRVAELVQFLDHVAQVLPDEMRQHEAVVQLGVPALEVRRTVGLLPEARHQRPHQQLLGQAHAGMRRHLEGAHLQQAQATGGAVGRIQLVDAELGAVGVAADVDQQVAHHPVDQPGRARGHAVGGDALQFGEGDLDLVDRVVARFVDPRRLAGGADEQAREQVAQRRVVVPVAHHAGQQVGPAQEGGVGHRGATEHEVVAPTGAGVAPVEHELLGRQPGFVAGLVEVGGLLDQFGPAVGGVDVDLDHARVGRHPQGRQARVLGRLVALQDHRQLHLQGGVFNGGHHLQVVLQRGGGGHEDVEPAFAGLGTDGGAGDRGGRFKATRCLQAGLGAGGSCRGGRPQRRTRTGSKAAAGAGASGPARGGAHTPGAFAAARGISQALVRRQRNKGLRLVDGVDPRQVAVGGPGL